MCCRVVEVVGRYTVAHHGELAISSGTQGRRKYSTRKRREAEGKIAALLECIIAASCEQQRLLPRVSSMGCTQRETPSLPAFCFFITVGSLCCVAIKMGTCFSRRTLPAHCPTLQNVQPPLRLSSSQGKDAKDCSIHTSSPAAGQGTPSLGMGAAGNGEHTM